MTSNPATKKLIQITEDSIAPVNVPLIVGNDCYMVTQQDMRRIEDIRLLSFNKLHQNGDLQPVMETAVVELLFAILKNKYINVNCQCLLTPNCKPEIQKASRCDPQPMEVTSSPNVVAASCNAVATIEQQLKWDKCTNTSVAFPFTYSRCTSTTDLHCYYPPPLDSTKQQQQQMPLRNICSCTKTVKFSQGTNTTNGNPSSTKSCLGAREQLKQRKMYQSYIS